MTSLTIVGTIVYMKLCFPNSMKIDTHKINACINDTTASFML